MYIDSEGTFRPENITKIAERFGLDGEECLNNIAYCRVFTSEHQSTLLSEAAALLMEDTYAL
jgi:RecA/RadA recombinase